MSTYTEDLASLTYWPHASHCPEDLADAGLSYIKSKELTMLMRQVCKSFLYDWELEDCRKLEYYYRSRSYLRCASKPDSTLSYVGHAAASQQEDLQVSP